MAVRLKKYSFRFSEELFNSRLAPKSEIEQILYAACVDFSKLNREGLKNISVSVALKISFKHVSRRDLQKNKIWASEGRFKKEKQGIEKTGPCFFAGKTDIFYAK